MFCTEKLSFRNTAAPQRQSTLSIFPRLWSVLDKTTFASLTLTLIVAEGVTNPMLAKKFLKSRKRKFPRLNTLNVMTTKA